MPTYEYTCDACKAEFERVQRFADDPIRECPVCGAQKARRRISAAGIVFKGSGWYVHDSKRKTAAKPASASGSSSKDGDGDKVAAATDSGSSGAESAAAKPSDSAPATPDTASSSGGSAPVATGAPSGATSGASTGGATSGTSSPKAQSAP